MKNSARTAKTAMLNHPLRSAEDAALSLRVTQPACSREFIARPALDQVFLAPGWTALIAPSGYGKTRQALHWYNDVRLGGHMALWINCGMDRDWDTTLATVDRLCRENGVRGSQDNPPLALFMDDCDDVFQRSSGADPRALLQSLPKTSRILTTGQYQVPADHILTADDLRLDDADALALFRNLEPGTTPDEATNMALRDGWVPAINIAVTAAACGQPADQALLAGDGMLVRHWAKWLSDESLRTFIGSLTILERCEVDLAAVASGCPNAGNRIDNYRRTTPFFRNETITELARHHFAPSAAEQKRLHTRVADWLIDQGRELDAVPHLIACERADTACEILDGNLLSLIVGGDLQRALGWLDAMDPDLIAARPSLSLAAALAFATSGDRVQADRYLRYHSTDERYVLEMLLATHADDPDSVLRFCGLIHSRDQLSPMSRMFLRNCEKMVMQKQGRWPTQSIENEADLHSLGGDSLRSFQAYSYALFRQAIWHLQQGQARRGTELLIPALTRSDAAFGIVSIPSMLFAMTLAGAWMQMGDVGAARQVLLGRRPNMENHIVPGVWSIGMIVLARLAMKRGDEHQGIATLEQMQARAAERDTPAIEAMAIAERVRMEITMGRSPGLLDRDRLTQIYAAAVAVPVNGPHIRLEALKGLARIALINGDAKASENFLREGQRLAAKLNRRLDGLEFALLRGTGADISEFQNIDAADAAELRHRVHARHQDQQHMKSVNSSASSVVSLTVREHEVLGLLEQHLSNKAIARELDLGPETVKWHVANLLGKLGASDRLHAIERARALGLLRFQFGDAPL